MALERGGDTLMDNFSQWLFIWKGGEQLEPKGRQVSLALGLPFSWTGRKLHLWAPILVTWGTTVVDHATYPQRDDLG